MLTVLLFFFGLVFRLISINQSIWLDEAISANVAAKLNYHQIITGFSPFDFHPPLYYLTLKFWSQLFGPSVISLRLLSILFSLATAYIVFLICQKFYSKVAYWATAFFMFNPLIIYYSQEIRMYSMVTFFLTASFYLMLIIAHQKHSTKHLLLFNFFTFLSFSTFYGSIFFLFAIYLYLLLHTKKSLFLKTLPGILLSLLILSPLLLSQFKNSRIMLQLVPHWDLVLGKVTLKNLLLIPVKFAIGHISFLPKYFYYFISSIWTIFIFTSYIFTAKHHQKLLYFFIFPLFIATLFSLSSPMLQYFRFIYLIPILAISLSLINSKFIKSIILFGFVIFSLIYLINPTFHREDWQSLSVNLSPQTSVWMIPSFADPLKYYYPDIVINDISKVSQNSPSRLYVIPYGEAIHGIDHQKILETNDYIFQYSRDYRQLNLQYWER